MEMFVFKEVYRQRQKHLWWNSVLLWNTCLFLFHSHCKHGVLTTGPPRKALVMKFLFYASTAFSPSVLALGVLHYYYYYYYYYYYFGRLWWFLRTCMSCYSRIDCYTTEENWNAPGPSALDVLLPTEEDLLTTLTASTKISPSHFLFLSERALWPCHSPCPHGFAAPGWTLPVGNAWDSEMGFPKTKWTLFLPFQREPHRKENKKFNF